MTWTPTRAAVKWKVAYDRCPKCGYFNVDRIVVGVRHEDSCEYYIYRDKIAPTKHQKLIHNADRALPLLLGELGISYQVFQMKVGENTYIDVFTQEDAAAAIELYNAKLDYAGMDLGEFLRRMVRHED